MKTLLPLIILFSFAVCASRPATIVGKQTNNNFELQVWKTQKEGTAYVVTASLINRGSAMESTIDLMGVMVVAKVGGKEKYFPPGKIDFASGVDSCLSGLSGLSVHTASHLSRGESETRHFMYTLPAGTVPIKVRLEAKNIEVRLK